MSAVAKINKIIENTSIEFEHNFNTENIKDNVFICNASSISKLNEAIEKLKHFLQHEPNIALIIIDSFSFHFKSIEDSYYRMNKIYQALSSLQSLIALKNIAVNNQIKTNKRHICTYVFNIY